MLRAFLLTCTLSSLATLISQEYEVILLAQASPEEQAYQLMLEHYAAELNARCDDYPSARAYFGWIDTTSNYRWLLFGWRDQVTGLIKEDFPRSLETIQHVHIDDHHPFANAKWISVDLIREQLEDPEATEASLRDQSATNPNITSPQNRQGAGVD